MPMSARASRPPTLMSDSSPEHWEALFRQNWSPLFHLAQGMCRGEKNRARRIAAAAFCQAARQFGAANGARFSHLWAGACLSLSAREQPSGAGSDLASRLGELSHQQQLAFWAFDVCRLPARQAAALAGVTAADFGRLLLSARLALCGVEPSAAAEN